MKIALFWNGSVSLDRIAFRHENYLAGCAALGHEAVLVTAEELVGRFGGRTHLVPNRAALDRAETWRAIEADVAIGITWHRMSGMLAAIRAAGTRVVAIAESDGQVGFAAHPRLSWLRIAAYQTSVLGRIRALRYFFRRVAASARRRDPEDLEFVASSRASDRIALGSAQAIECFARFLRQQGAAELATRLCEVPYAVPDSFCAVPLGAKEDRVVAIGRWGDPQKDAPLLAAALERFFTRRSSTEVVVFGADAEGAFGALARREPRLRLAGFREPEVIARELATTRAAVCSSRWEGGPHIAHEALVLGATLVSPPMPNFEGMVAGGRFGTLAGNRNPEALASALCRELSNWDEGRRDAGAIAAHWRARLAPVAVCRSLLEALEH